MSARTSAIDSAEYCCLQVALIGALSVFPLAFVLTLLMYVQVGWPGPTKRWHDMLC